VGGTEEIFSGLCGPKETHAARPDGEIKRKKKKKEGVKKYLPRSPGRVNTEETGGKRKTRRALPLRAIARKEKFA